MVTTKEALKQIIEELPERRARRLLEAMRDPVLRARITAPIDDEPESDEERAAVAEAREAVARGELISTEQLNRELGL
jgi:hypothetical protein